MSYLAKQPVKFLKPDAGTIALYNFDGNLNDSVNGKNFTVALGTPTYTYGELGASRGYLANNNMRITQTDASFRVSTSMTIELIVRADVPAVTRHWCSYGHFAAPDQRRMYYIQFEQSTGFASGLTLVYCGFDDTGATARTTSADIVQSSSPVYLAFTRLVSGGTTVSKIYVNGKFVASTSVAATPTSTGTNTTFYGPGQRASNDAGPDNGRCYGLHLTTTVFTDEQIYQRALDIFGNAL